MLEAKQIELEKPRFHDVFLEMTPFSAKKSEKIKLLGEKIYPKPEEHLKSSLIMLFNDV